MSIVPLIKVTLYGRAAEKEAVLEGLQTLGCLHLNDLRPPTENAGAPPETHAGAREALRYLYDSPVRRPALPQPADFEVETVVKEVIDVRDHSRALTEEREQVRKWIADLEPWGDFEFPEWANEGALRFWFYTIPNHRMDRLRTVALPWRTVARDHRFAYVVVVAADQPAGMPVAPTPLVPRSLSKLRARLQQIDRELGEFDYRRIGLTLYRDALSNALDEADDRAARQRAAFGTLEQDQVFAVQGWAPGESVAALRQFADGRQLALIIEQPGPQETPPTLLHNRPALRGGEGLVTFYRTPGYHMWDPSKAVFFAFAVFFAMIFSDAGYGLVLGLILLVTWKRLGRSNGGRDLRDLILALVVGSIIYGVLVGTYFGVRPPAGSWLASLHVLDPEDQRLMMWIAIGMGVAHLTFANLVTAWRRRRTPMALSAVGWACIILGGFCLGLGKSRSGLERLATVGLAGLGLGGLLVLVFSSERPINLTPKALFGRLTDGLKATTSLSKVFGDVLSYLRLFALGLASVKLAEAFNDLAGRSFASRGAWILLGLLVLIVGHGINFAMGIMSGLVHGLRLNAIEFFNWSLPEEGEQFRIFARKAEP
jgi:V/A-type H+/Na+-transporting ATPase subunit I